MMFKIEKLLAVAVAVTVTALPTSAQVVAADKAPVAVDGEAAIELARRESCLKCHSIDKKKDAPAYKQIAAKYKNDPEAEEKLIRHVKSGRLVKVGDDEDEHRVIKTKDESAIRNLIRWILAQ